jgi:hypothetical protein
MSRKLQAYSLDFGYHYFLKPPGCGPKRGKKDTNPCMGGGGCAPGRCLSPRAKKKRLRIAIWKIIENASSRKEPRTFVDILAVYVKS